MFDVKYKGMQLRILPIGCFLHISGQHGPWDELSRHYWKIALLKYAVVKCEISLVALSLKGYWPTKLTKLKG
jgi:hypothetical protein